MPRPWRFGAAIGIALVALAACGLDQPKATPPEDDEPRVSADDLGDAFEDSSAADYLAPEEREALHRAGADDAAPPAAEPRKADDPPKGFFARTADQVGKVGVALLGVGVTLGMMAAPYLLF